MFTQVPWVDNAVLYSPIVPSPKVIRLKFVSPLNMSTGDPSSTSSLALIEAIFKSVKLVHPANIFLKQYLPLSSAPKLSAELADKSILFIEAQFSNMLSMLVTFSIFKFSRPVISVRFAKF